MRTPSAAMMGTVTADSGSVGAVETGLCSLAWRAGRVSSYKILPLASMTCRPISSDRALDSAIAASDSRFQPPSARCVSAILAATTFAISSTFARV